MTVKALKKKNNMKPFKLRSGNKPSIAKLSGVSPMRDMIKEEESKVPKTTAKQEVDNMLKAYRRLEAMENRTPEQEAKFKKLGNKLDEVYKDDTRN
tara:strand:- start:11 stop:298 length:288 start_codon:yes stop_codon:yes gene_type:complete